MTKELVAVVRLADDKSKRAICGSVNPCITKRTFSESSGFLVMTQRIRIKLLHCNADLVAASTAAL